MKALVYTAIRALDVLDVPKPNPKSDEILVKVTSAGVCGVDVHGFTGRNPFMSAPRILGHELVGEVAEACSFDGHLAIGDRVIVDPLVTCGTCQECLKGNENLCANWRLLGTKNDQGAFAEYIAIRADKAHSIASHVTDGMATLVEPLASSVHLMEHIGSDSSKRLVIFGAGLQGLMTLTIAKLKGFKDLIVVDPIPTRLSIAQKLGAAHVLDPSVESSCKSIKELCGGVGADIVVESARSADARKDALCSLRKGGLGVFLGLNDPTCEVNFGLIVRNELQVRGSFGYVQSDFILAKKLIESGKIDIEPWIEKYPVEEGQSVFEAMTNMPTATLKRVLVM